MAFGQLPAYQGGNALNFQPVQNALSDVAQTNQQYARMAQQQQSIDLEKQRTASELQTLGLQRQQLQGHITKQHIDAAGGLIQDAANDPDPASRQQKMLKLNSVDPMLGEEFKRVGIDVNHPDAALQANAMLRGYQNPLDVRTKELANQTAQQNLDMGKFQKVAPGEVAYTFQNGKWGPIDGGSADPFTKAGYGPNGEAPGTWGTPAAAPGGGAGAPSSPGAPQVAPGQQGAMPPEQFNRTNFTGASYPQGLPQTGDPTALASGAAAPGMQSTPAYFSPDDVQRARLEAQMSPRLATALSHTQGAVSRDAYGKEIGHDQAATENTRKSLAPVLSMMEDIKRDATAAGPATLHMATGPNYGSEDPKSWNPLPNTSGGSYQAARAFMNNWMAGAPDAVSSALGAPRDSNAAYALNTKMQHLKKAVATLYKSVPGAGGKIGGTDQSQRELEDAIGEMMKTADPETFFSILHDATNTARGLGAYDPLPRSEKYSPWDANGKPIAAAPSGGLPAGNYVWHPQTGLAPK